MGGLFILNDSEQRIYWKKNIFKIETFIQYESSIVCVLNCISYLTFPFDSLKFVNKNFPADLYVFCCILFSLASFICSLLIKYIHLKNTIKPNYRLCLMNFLGTIGFFCSFIACGYTLCISFVLIEWENLSGIFVSYKRALSSKSKEIVIPISRAIFTLIWNHIVLLSSFCCFIDFAIEIINITKAAKYLSEGNNINNQNLLHELFKMTVKNKINNSINSMNTLDTNKNINKKEAFSKFRIIMSDKDNTENSFENENNKFREVEIIQKVDYKSIGVQTEDNKDNFYNNYINNSNNRTVDEDLSNNIILIRNKPLIDSKISFFSNS